MDFKVDIVGVEVDRIDECMIEVKRLTIIGDIMGITF